MGKPWAAMDFTNTVETFERSDTETALIELGIAAKMQCRVRDFTDGALIGSKDLVNKAFAAARERFGPMRQDGARSKKGTPLAARALRSARD